MADTKLWLSWETYQKNICSGLGLLQQRGEFVDMTIAADGHHVKAHQMVLSLISPFIKELIASAQCSHPIIFLNRVSYPTLQSILEYAYTGEVLITRDGLAEFLEACTALHIKGLEKDSLKTTTDGTLLNVLGARGNQNRQEIEEPKLKATENERPSVGGSLEATLGRIKRKRTDVTDIEDHGSFLDDTHDKEDSHMGDITSHDDDDDDVIKDQDDQPAAKKALNSVSNFPLQYSLSCQGSIQLVLNRFIYRLRHTRRNNEKMWRCVDYNKKACPAFLITRGDVVIERGCAHEHPFHDRQILKRIRNGNMYTAFNAVENIASLNKPSTRAESKDKGD